MTGETYMGRIGDPITLPDSLETVVAREPLDKLEGLLQHIQQVQRTLPSSVPLSIGVEGELVRERWETLYAQVLQRPQEYLTLNTHAAHFLQQMCACLTQYYNFVAEQTFSQEPSASSRRELIAHYYFVRTFIWSCILFHRHEHLAWNILQLVAEERHESIPLTLVVALALTEEPEGDIVTPAPIASVLARIAPFYSMMPASNGGFLKLLVPSTLVELHTGHIDPQTPLPVASQSLYAYTSFLTEYDDTQDGIPDIFADGQEQSGGGEEDTDRTQSMKVLAIPERV